MYNFHVHFYINLNFYRYMVVVSHYNVNLYSYNRISM